MGVAARPTGTVVRSPHSRPAAASGGALVNERILGARSDARSRRDRRRLLSEIVAHSPPGQSVAQRTAATGEFSLARPDRAARRRRKTPRGSLRPVSHPGGDEHLRPTSSPSTTAHQARRRTVLHVGIGRRRATGGPAPSIGAGRPRPLLLGGQSVACASLPPTAWRSASVARPRDRVSLASRRRFSLLASPRRLAMSTSAAITKMTPTTMMITTAVFMHEEFPVLRRGKPISGRHGCCPRPRMPVPWRRAARLATARPRCRLPNERRRPGLRAFPPSRRRSTSPSCSAPLLPRRGCRLSRWEEWNQAGDGRRRATSAEDRR